MAKILDVGCGSKKVPGAIGVDQVALEGVDVVCDLGKFPWPFQNDEFDRVHANHFLEHCEDVVAAICELHRITRSGEGRISIRVPHYTSWNYYADLTHRVPFSYRSFDHFTLDDATGYNYYSPVKFRIAERRICFVGPEARVNPWKWLGIDALVNRFPRYYERMIAWILPATEVRFELIPIDAE